MTTRSSLRRRVVAWMCASALVSVAVFGAIAWLLVRLEVEESEPSGDRAAEVAEDPEDASEQILGAMLIAGPIALAAAVALGFAWSRRITRPLEQVIATARDMTTDDLDARLTVPTGDDELAELVRELNQLFGRLEEGFATLDRHVTEASHELRTPVAVAAAQLEVALRHPRTADEWEHIARKALAEVRRTARLVDALLRIARSESAATGDAPAFDVAAGLAGVVELMAEPARLRGLSLELAQDQPSLHAIGDEDTLLASIRALVDNAMDHARERVAITLARDGDQVAIHVDDDGPGVSPDDRARIFEPFVRGRTLADRTGLGLGLHVGRRLVAASGGELDVGEAPGGGARFTIRLRSAPAGSAD